MGRRKKHFVPTVTDENLALAEEFLQVLSRHYEDYVRLFASAYQNEDVCGETILKCYNAIRYNGLKNINEKQGREREQTFKDYFFISAKLNNITDKTVQGKLNTLDGVKRIDEEDIDDKIKRNLLTDFKVISILEIVEDAFDEIDYRCFRLYHLLKGMTYKKLREITRIPNCKARVVKINKWLRENVREQDIIRTFEDIYDE